MIYIERLKNIREENEVNQKTIADFLQISRGLYSQYEIEDKIFPVKHLNQICNYFDVSFDYLFKISNEKKYDNCNSIIDKVKAGIRLKEFRKNNKLTQGKLAEIINATKSTICEYEKGNFIIATPFLYDLCKKYDVSADYILGRIDYNPKEKNLV